MNVGIVGCGGIANVHIEAYKWVEDVKVTAVCDLDLKKAKILARRFKVGKVFSNYWDMINTGELDLVDICTPVSTHTRIICDVAKVVPAILVEKPMALNVSECDEIIKEVGKHKSKLCIGHNQIFLPTIQKAKSLVDSGDFDLFSFRTTVKENFEFNVTHEWAAPWNVTPQQKGIIWESCCHLAYLQLHFLPNINEVYAVGDKLKYPVYDDFGVLLRTEDKRFGIIELSWLAKETGISYELRDKTGRCIEIHRDFDYLVEKSETQPYNVRHAIRNLFVDEKRILRKWMKYGLRYLRRGKILPTFLLISSFIHSIRKDLPPPVPPEDGKKTIALLECIKKSLDESKPIALCV